MAPIVLTEVYRGDSRDVRLNRLLKDVSIPVTDDNVAKLAGVCLAQTGGSNAPDAQVVAHAITVSPCVLLTSDPHDIEDLLAAFREATQITVLDVGTPGGWPQELQPT